VKIAGSLAVAGAVCAALLASGSAAAGDGVTPCPRERIRTASGCTGLAAAGREIRAIVERSVQDNDLRAALARVDLGDRSIARVSAGESMDGVPANLRMNFRVGSVAIPYVIDLLLQLQDDGRLSLDAPLSNWFPDIRDADRVTLITTDTTPGPSYCRAIGLSSSKGRLTLCMENASNNCISLATAP
jgi:D-alanyl-D-alanine carboxypeptidase